MSTTPSLPAFTPAQAKAAREWLAAACDYGESVVSPHYIRTQAPAADCVACAVASYPGGWEAFLEEAPLPVPEPAKAGKEVAA